MARIPDNRWYLAYGSSISSQLLLKQGVVPLASHVVRVPNARLLFNVHFLPFWEPVLANLEIRQPAVQAGFQCSDIVRNTKEPTVSTCRRVCEDGKEESSSVIGVAYLLTAEDYRRFVASESRGTFYEEVVVRCYPLSKGLANHVFPSPSGVASERSCSTDIQILAHTLVSRMTPYSNNSKPSKRYMDSMVLGAIEQKIPGKYRRALGEIPYDEIKGLQIIPAVIFLSLWIIPLLITLILHGAFVPERRNFIASLCRTPYRAVVNTMWIQYQVFWERFCESDSGRTMVSTRPFDNMGSRRGLATAINLAQSGPLTLSTL